MRIAMLFTLILTCFPAEPIPKSTLLISYETVFTQDPVTHEVFSGENYHYIE